MNSFAPYPFLLYPPVGVSWNRVFILPHLPFKMTTFTLSHPSGASATIDPFGATVVSWILPSGKQMLYLSKLADTEGKRAIRGGIPVIFPQFNSGCFSHLCITLRGTADEARIRKNVVLDKRSGVCRWKRRGLYPGILDFGRHEEGVGPRVLPELRGPLRCEYAVNAAHVVSTVWESPE